MISLLWIDGKHIFMRSANLIWLFATATLLIELAIVLYFSRVAVGNPISTTREGALLTVDKINDVVKWMASLETAVLGGLAYLLLGTETPLVNRISSAQSAIVAVAGIDLGIALFTSVWIFTSLGSIGARLHGLATYPSPSGAYDIAEWTLYSVRSGARIWTAKSKFYKLGYVITCKHWFLGLGLVALAVFFVVLVVHPPQPPTAKTKNILVTMTDL